MQKRDELLEALQAAPDALLLIEEVKQHIEHEINKRKEFYALVHEDHKVEFINGEIVFQSPVRKAHWLVSTRLASRLNSYVEENKLGIVGVEKVMITLSRNDYEPDICFFSSEKAKSFTDEQMRFPAPDFVVEILSDSTEERDRGIKMRDYAAHKIPEYWIINSKEKTIEQYWLKDKHYELHQKVAEGKITALVIKGFSIALSDLFGEIA